MEAMKYWLWLCSRKGLYYQGIKRLLEVYQDVAGIYHAFIKEDITACLSPYYRKHRENIFPRDQWGDQYLESYQRKLQQMKIGFISIESKHYPSRLCEIDQPPFGLFYKGNLDLLNYDYLAVAGSRHPSAYGRQMSDYIGFKLVQEGIPIISGMAMGIDSLFHEQALKLDVPTIGILGQGVDICYPRKVFEIYRQLSEKGLLLSEFAPTSHPLNFHFPFRNRIITGLSKALLVVEAGLKSGTAHTVEHALSQGKDIFAIPSPMLNKSGEGTNKMIYDGAEIICNWEQLLENLDKIIVNREKKIEISKYEESKAVILENNEALVYSMLNKEPIYLEDVVRKSHLDRVKVRRILLELQQRGVCKEIYPLYFVKI